MVKENKDIVLIGYSGHSFVVLEIFNAMGRKVSSYCDVSEKSNNPYLLNYIGNENDASFLEKLKKYDCFISIGKNEQREACYNQLKNIKLENAIHPSSIISESAKLGNGIMVGSNAIINAQSSVGNCVILNTGCIIEHECFIEEFVHIAPGAVLCGSVSVGKGSFIGANAVVKQGIKIGKNATIGAGAVITKNVVDNSTFVGNPQRLL